MSAAATIEGQERTPAPGYPGGDPCPPTRDPYANRGLTLALPLRPSVTVACTNLELKESGA